MNKNMKAAHAGLTPIALSLPGLVCGLLWASAVSAVTVIPEKGGVSGYVNLGIGAMELESNLIAKAAGGIVDVSDARIEDIGSSPDKELAAVPMLNFELSYTFEDTRTQLYVGNLLEDFLTLDLSAQGGVRQGVPGVGIFGFAFVSSSLSADVWEDPYESGVEREDTERTAAGYRLNWNRIFDSGLKLEYSSKDFDIDEERSGEGLGLSASERSLLDRNGDSNRMELGYEFHFANDRHILTPALVYRDNDRDGGAMANDGYGATLNYIYRQNQRWRWAFNVAYQRYTYNEANPVYGIEDDADQFGFSATGFYSEPFGWKPWILNVTAGYFEEDHDIDFYDAAVTALTVSMLRRF